MATLPAGSITVHRLGRMGGMGGEDTLVCTTCGAVVASEYGSRHISWHAQAAWAQATVTADGTTTAVSGLPLAG